AEAFRPPGGKWVDLSRSPALARLFATLLEARVEQPGKSLAVDILQQKTWPDERLLDDAAMNRLNVNLSKLRSLGLRPILQRVDEGYLFDDAVEIVDIQ
ncbi:MAG: hypothetical protein ACNA8W_07515, partial [Bradymonadaceae bacterium]